MTVLEEAQAIIEQIKGCTSTLTVGNAISALQDLLLKQKESCSEAHKKVNQAKDVEEDEKNIYRRIDALFEHCKRQRQELRSEQFIHNL